MKPIDQTQLHTESMRGNCTEAALASLFELGIDDVPQFSEMNESGRWYIEFVNWCARRGIELYRFDEEMCFAGYYLASGPSPRGVNHMVVMKDGALAHDPHPSRDGIERVDCVYVFLPLDPAVLIADRTEGTRS